ncbi:hypothetical protein HHK36_016164 [Tetracentron sinense]|uniref:pyruvate decarboxylase n=1 Tax=Tetracentron sinense TaxID=13715 RepID=A0A834YWP2_TETSI|nr:hypothetical protein HHK36_016164 [Tetracentron sinense]
MENKIGTFDTSKLPSNGVACPPDNEAAQNSVPPSMIGSSDSTLGSHLARRLVQVGVTDVFSVPGDFNLTLLDYLVAEPGLNLIGCCNELNAGYAADGYARSRGVGACVVTFTVGGLSVLNAIAGAYSEKCTRYFQELRCFQTVTCYQAVVDNLEEAHELIDTAISTALRESKPVYISIGCNLPAVPHPTFTQDPIPFSLPPKMSNQMGLEAAVEATVEFLNKAVKPVMVGGPKLRVAKACEAFTELANASGYALAVMPSAKGQVPEHHPRFIGTYWGVVSTAFCAEIVESADAYLFAGPIFNECSSVGYSLLLNKKKAIMVHPDRVVVGNGPAFGCILMKDFFRALSKRLKRNTTAYENYHRIYVPDGLPLKSEPKEALRVNILFKHIQNMLSGDMAVIAETGDSWFCCQKLKLPQGCGYEFQMQYGSIGWSVGATLGYAQAVPDKRVIACIGDGSFQMTAQDVSTMLRCEQKSIIFLINNGGYSTEVEIHDGPYNVIKNWNYAGLVDAIHNGQGKCWTTKVGVNVLMVKYSGKPDHDAIDHSLINLVLQVRCEEELMDAIETTMGAKKDCLCFIEVIVHKDDTSKELLEFGSRVSAANSRQPNAQ